MVFLTTPTTVAAQTGGRSRTRGFDGRQHWPGSLWAGPLTTTNSNTPGVSCTWSKGAGLPSRRMAPENGVEDHGKSVASMVVIWDGMNIVVYDDGNMFIKAANISHKTAAKMETLSEECSGNCPTDSAKDRERGGRDLLLRSNVSARGDKGAQLSNSTSRNKETGKDPKQDPDLDRADCCPFTHVSHLRSPHTNVSRGTLRRWRS